MERFFNDCYSYAFLVVVFRAQSAVGQPFGGRCCLMPFISASAAYRELPRWGMLDEKAIQP
ncbi:hypothetical protein [Prevotella corporis]|uniref:hypothetical protein n=1 Tax=Prevotella corporis TaxID=28128 RepID=UPI0012DE0918|nr:hypothetical protein [Prevotella corporis]